jgi:GTP pyrophosphokinase
MVQVRQQPILADGSIDLPLWIDLVCERTGCGLEDKKQLQKACELAQALDTSPGKPGGSFATGLEMAQILADLHLDHNTLVAAGFVSLRA